MKCFVNFVNQENGEEDAYKILDVPATAEKQMEEWATELCDQMEPIRKGLDKNFGASHSLLIIVKDGAEEIFSLHID